MVKLIDSIKSVKISQVIIVFLAGFILLVNTACSSPNSKLSNKLDGTTVSSQEAPKYDAYDATQPKQGGMNGYNDDQRLDNPRVQAKGKKLVDQANARDPKVDSPQDLANEVGKGLNKFPDIVSQQAQDKANLAQENLDKASRIVNRTADKASNAAQNTIDDAGRAIEKAM